MLTTAIGLELVGYSNTIRIISFLWLPKAIQLILIGYAFLEITIQFVSTPLAESVSPREVIVLIYPLSIK
jgi:hypothetical protein